MQPDRGGGGLEAGMPCASSPPIIPDSTSPLPAVARSAARCRRWPRGRPGAATTVSGPLSTTTAPDRRAASRARSTFEWRSAKSTGTGARTRPRGACSTTGALPPSRSRVEQRRRWRRRTTSAHRRRERPRRVTPAPPRRVATVASPTPSAGPSTTAFCGGPARIVAKPAGPSIGSSMIAVRCAALTASASGGEATVTSPDADAERAARRQPRRAGARRRPRDDHRVAAVVLVHQRRRAAAATTVPAGCGTVARPEDREASPGRCRCRRR